MSWKVASRYGGTVKRGVAPTQANVVTGVYAQTGDVFLKCVELDASLAHLVQSLVVSLVYEFFCC